MQAAALSEQQVKNWARALSETENDKCVKTVAGIRKILENYFAQRIKVFLQGSYANSTNVRQDSDVDIVVCYQDAYFPDYSSLDPISRVLYERRGTTHHYSFADFKNEVGMLLKNNFSSSVVRKGKCIQVKGNTYRVNADVVPCFQHKKFTPYGEIIGVQLLTDETNLSVVNFPVQHQTNGETKNKLTNGKYKAVVRILKNSRNFLINNEYISEKFMPSFFLECLIWNVPNNFFIHNSYQETVNNVIKKIYSDMGDFYIANSYMEINNLIPLFNSKRISTTAKQFLELADKVIN